MKRNEYQEYLKSPEWEARRRMALDLADYRCQLCNSRKRLEVHHRTYKNVGNEFPGDLTVLCHFCHEKFTRKVQKIMPNQKIEAINKQINRLRLWRKRARFSELVDIDRQLKELFAVRNSHGA